MNAKVNYAVSYNMATGVLAGFSNLEIELNKEAVMEAVNDAFSGKPSQLSDAQFKETQVVVKDKMIAAKLRAEEQAKKSLEKQAEVNKAEGEAFLAKNKSAEGVITTASGLQYRVDVQGSGPKPTESDRVTAHYQGTFLNGKPFDSSIKRGKPMTFGVQDVIPGWTEGIQLMPVGSKYTFWIPSDLAYGVSGRPPVIAPNATLKFEVELISIEK
ncbi:putative Peptidylprolyl isomerase [Magnetofaba australis IT-1]|uniref:Peptidyl-prolyl cis-trans isomerase n=2 Tax=Magnetofaba TaxID=1472292 RepID=A0A1Y2KAI4_9PROT|nr:putative Peptidylprolyl isomerase [Magnetofaba australis IT-1]